MSKIKIKPTNIFNIFFKGLFLYIKNFFLFSKVMLFPVFGQVLGIFLIFYPTYLYRENLILRLNSLEIQSNLIYILLGLIIIVMPGFAIFFKAFWDYMISMVSLNTIACDVFIKKMKTGFKHYNAAVKLRTQEYLYLLFILMGIWLLLLILPFFSLASSFFLNSVYVSLIFIFSYMFCLLFLAVISVYLGLSFQIFAFEPITPINVIKKSWTMVEGNFWRIFVLGAILFLITGMIVPLFANTLVENSPIFEYLIQPVKIYSNIIIENSFIFSLIEKYNISISDFSKIITISTIDSVITAFMLPLGTICYMLLYFEINERKNLQKNKKK